MGEEIKGEEGIGQVWGWFSGRQSGGTGWVLDLAGVGPRWRLQIYRMLICGCDRGEKVCKSSEIKARIVLGGERVRGKEVRWCCLKNSIQLNNNFAKRMIEELTASLFQESTEMYRQGNYPVCLALLNDVILLEPSRSTYYSNRAISHFHHRQLDLALADLETSLGLNHLNYTAYFNLFSLHMTSCNSELAFSKLALALSSILTLLGRLTNRHETVDRSIYYSYNNKQAIFLKAMLSLQEHQFENALLLVQTVLNLENRSDNRSKLVYFANYIAKLLQKEPLLEELPQLKSGHYELKTSLICPRKELFESKIEEMLNEFNQLYNMLCELQNGWNIKELPNQQESTHSLSNNSCITQDKIEKETNCVTTYESNYDQESGITSDNYREMAMKLDNHEMRQSFCKEDRMDKLNLYSIVSDPESSQQSSMFPIDEETQSKMNSYLLYPLRNSQEAIRIFIEKAHIELSDKQKHKKYDSIYTIFSYNGQTGQQTVRTGISRCHEGLSRWEEWSDEINLSINPSNIKFKIYNKSYVSFKDDFIGEGEMELSSSGYNKISFFNSEGDYIGEMEITIEVCA